MELVGVLVDVLLAISVIVIMERSARKEDWYELERRRLQEGTGRGAERVSGEGLVDTVTWNKWPSGRELHRQRAEGEFVAWTYNGKRPIRVQTRLCRNGQVMHVVELTVIPGSTHTVELGPLAVGTPSADDDATKG